MICFISEQVLPNFIPVNEPVTRPDALHMVFTPRDPKMRGRWESFARVIAQKFPDIRASASIQVSSAYKPAEVLAKIRGLLDRYPNDHWSLNATGGTKLMVAPALELLRQREGLVYYTETPRNSILIVAPDWSVREVPFQESVDLQTYFELFGCTATTHPPRTQQETTLLEALGKLEWTPAVYSSVHVHDGVGVKTSVEPINEFDAIGISKYRLHAFECKRLFAADGDSPSGPLSSIQRRRAQDAILSDLYKLSQFQRAFGGPFGSSYWILGGRAKMSQKNTLRMRHFGITLLQETDLPTLTSTSGSFGLPPPARV